ncbi:BrnT family toxin [Candidatus Symbiobacter mobilis]|uniref:BrnT family toxin n=1 Tax=Candidatus Symbiobacter mobilis CR TaxID=946483 RepID=U5NBJ3_9BURK|nr:BrnT family toxin [Candidatus Symbiobacter mobilis]AGX87544.1 hypothetical protein Cenrod_1458 [Candidatus Symbiobacter mobilis CR]
MNTRYFWDDAKRQGNLEKHGLDFSDADLVLTSNYRLDLPSERNGERRVQSFAYVFEVLTVLTVVFLPGAEGLRIISFRRANRSEREVYHDWLDHDWLENNGDDI